MRRKDAAVGLTGVASVASARVAGCWGEDLRYSEPPGHKGGCPPLLQETATTRRRVDQS